MTLVNANSVQYNCLGIPEYHESLAIGNDLLDNLALWSIVLAFVAVFTAFVISLVIDRRYKWFERIANKSLAYVFALVWLFGFIVYNVGMYTGESLSLLGNVPMAILHAFGIFIFDSDVSAIHEPFHNNWVFMTCFSLAHFLAALVSLVFVLKHFGFNIIAAFRRWFVSPKGTTYIFWGMNDATYYLAKDIIRQRDKDSRIVVVRTSSDTDAAMARNVFERFFNFLSLKNKDLDRLKELNCLTTNSFASISTIDIEPLIGSHNLDFLDGEMRLKFLCRLISKKTNNVIHMFFLSETEEENIQAVANIKRDVTISRFLDQAECHKVKLYCHARYNTIHRVIEDEQLSDKIEVNVIDSSHLSVELLKRNVDLQPVSYVNIETDATVSSPFNSLVVGFSEVGMDVVRFLYEFGAFVKTGSTNQKVERSEFCCHVIDKEMADLAGLFVANAPAIKPSMPFLENNISGKSLITLHQMDCRSVVFYQELESWIKDNLNYVVVCTGNDELNISLAVRIFKLAVRYRQDMENFCVLVRIKNDNNGHIQRIAEHYNRLWASELHSTDKKKRTHQKTITTNTHPRFPIYLFGLAKDTYTFDNIISENLDNEAKLYKERYDASVNALKKQSGNAEEDTLTWENEHKDLMQLTDEYKGFSPTYSGIMRLRRIQSQNKENSLHLQTKQRLAYRALGEDDFSVLAKHQLFRKENEITYTWKDYVKPRPSVNRVLDVLAQTEHLRWNASHEILGYSDEGDEEHKDEARLQHGCLKDWQELSTTIQSYDYNVVDVSLDIIEINGKND